MPFKRQKEIKNNMEQLPMVCEVSHRIEKKKDQIKKNILSNDSGILDSYPIDVVINAMAALPPSCGYAALGEDTISILDSVGEDYGPGVEALYCQLVALQFSEVSIKRLGKGALPVSLETLYLEWVKRIVDEFPLNLEGHYYKNDLFLKYLSVCSLRCIPVGGAWIAEVSGIARKFLFSGGGMQFVKATGFLLFSMKGAKPFYQIHMVQSMKDLVSPESRNQCYRGVARLLEANTQVKGMFAGSWYYDPAVKSISPRLSYMCKNAIENGARVFKVGSSITDINNATLTSPTRKKMYDNGQYLPTTYLLIWPRQNLLDWAALD